MVLMMVTKMLLLFLLCVPYVISEKLKIYQTVSTIYGDVKGLTMKSREGRLFSAFRGIPYAKPPVGNLRFKAPEEPEKWTDVFDGTKNGNICIQQNYLFAEYPEVEGSEDCLYINVYTPLVRFYVPSGKLLKPKELMPVMVFLHYGAFMAGSSSSDILGPEYFMDKDVLLVTFNYRLGIFGFFSTYDDVAPGNWAFKDQVAALRWVQTNIAEFGGDPKQVTIFGQSAGAGSVHMQLLSPVSKGLFQAAITQSGSALAMWAQPQREYVKFLSFSQGGALGCPNNSTIEMVSCLRELPAKQLVESMQLLRIMRSEPLTVFLPAIETESDENPEPFITKDPIDIIENGEFHNVPWIIGVVADEGILRAAPLTRQTDLLNKINEDLDNVLIDLMYLKLSLNPDEIPETVKQIKSYYLLNQNKIDVNNSTIVQGLISLYTDRGFFYPAYQSALMHRNKGHEKIWFYFLDYRGNRTYGELFAATENQIDFKWGISHGDDLLYLFNSSKLFPNYTLSSNDLGMSHFFINIFTNLAMYHHPTPGLDDSETWTPLPSTKGKEVLENGDLHFLKIKGKYSPTYNAFNAYMSNTFVANRMSFWKKLPLRENIDMIV